MQPRDSRSISARADRLDVLRDGSIATAKFINGKSHLNYFVVTSPDGTMSRRDIKELESFLKIK